MSLSERTLRNGAAVLAMAAVFGGMAPSVASAESSGAPSYPLQGQDGNLKLRIALGATLKGRVSVADSPNGSADSLSWALRDKMSALPVDGAGRVIDKPQMVTYPQSFTESMLVARAVVPPPSQAKADVPICFDKADGPGEPVKVVWKGHVTKDAEAISDTAPFVLPAGSIDRPCQAWARQEGIKLMRPSVQVDQRAISKPSASLATATPNG